jgi:hypothetical protein
MSIKKMTPDQWIKVPSNPRQRPTEAHAIKAQKKHLKAYSITQDTVFAVSLPGGLMVKLDGHTRAFLWEKGILEKPPCVYARVYSVKNMDEAKELYTHFDTKDQAENQLDIFGGALDEYSIDAASGLIKNKANSSAINKLEPTGKSTYQIVGAWKREIELLDSVGFSKNALRSGGVLGALVLLRFFPMETVLIFISKIKNDEGTKDANGSDAVQMFRRTHDAKGEGHSEQQIWDLAGRMVALYKGFMTGSRYLKCPPAVDVKAMIANARLELCKS